MGLLRFELKSRRPERHRMDQATLQPLLTGTVPAGPPTPHESAAFACSSIVRFQDRRVLYLRLRSEFVPCSLSIRWKLLYRMKSIVPVSCFTCMISVFSFLPRDRRISWAAYIACHLRVNSCHTVPLRRAVPYRLSIPQDLWQ